MTLQIQQQQKKNKDKRKEVCRYTVGSWKIVVAFGGLSVCRYGVGRPVTGAVCLKDKRKEVCRYRVGS